MSDAYLLVTPFVLLLLVGMLTRFIGCSSFGGSVTAPDSPSPDLVHTNTALTGSPNPSQLGGPVSFIATVTQDDGSAPTSGGNVDLREGGTLLQTIPLDGTGHSTFSQAFPSAGTHSIQASYSGVAGLVSPSGSVS